MENCNLNEPPIIFQVIPLDKVSIPIVINEHLNVKSLASSSKQTNLSNKSLIPSSSKMKLLKNISENTMTVRASSNNLNSVLYRKDAFGVPIVKGSKEHKISFYDILTRKKLATEVLIEKVNYNDSRRNKDSICQCSCLII